ncbi:hypothetical protein [Streptomyces sp. IBSBF 3136]|uniref:hypothetical protein n=1 Tax=Streptomyces sp. IBSBF 3136 TaxID=2903524 RepID=UPI002FDBE8B1
MSGGQFAGEPVPLAVVLLVVIAPLLGEVARLRTWPTRRRKNLVRAVRLGVNSACLVLVALIALAVGSELVIAHPAGHGSTTLALLLFGAPALYLATTAWFFGTSTRRHRGGHRPGGGGGRGTLPAPALLSPPGAGTSTHPR